MRWAWLYVVVPAVSLTACGSGSKAQEEAGDAPATVTPTAALVVTRDDSSLPPGCRPRELAALVTAFFDAFNRGDPTAARFVAPELAPNGGWYSVTEGAGSRRRHFVARNRGELRRYFSTRHRRKERLRLIELRVNSRRGDIEFAIERRADDLAPLGIRTPEAGGKGRVDCGRRKIVVWSMGMPHSGDRVCPAPTNDGRAAIACARRSPRAG